MVDFPKFLYIPFLYLLRAFGILCSLFVNCNCSDGHLQKFCVWNIFSRFSDVLLLDLLFALPLRFELSVILCWRFAIFFAPFSAFLLFYLILFVKTAKIPTLNKTIFLHCFFSLFPFNFFFFCYLVAVKGKYTVHACFFYC